MSDMNTYKVKIKNTNGIIDLSEPKINIIVGENASGKTTLFNVISSPFFKTKFSGIRLTWEIELPFGKIKGTSENKKTLYLPDGTSLWKEDDIKAYLSEQYQLNSFGFLFNYPFITYSIPQFFNHMVYRNLDSLLLALRIINIDDNIDVDLIEKSEDEQVREKLRNMKRLIAVIMIKKARHYVSDVIRNPILDVFDDLYNYLFTMKIEEDELKRNILKLLSKYVYELDMEFELSGKVFMTDILMWINDLLELLDKDLSSSEKNIFMTSIVLSELELYAKKIEIHGCPYIPFIAFDELVHHLDDDRKEYIIDMIVNRVGEINNKYGPKFGIVMTIPEQDYHKYKHILPTHDVIDARITLGDFIVNYV